MESRRSIRFSKITTETQKKFIRSFIHIVYNKHCEHSTNFFYCTYCYPLSIVQVSIVLKVLILPFQLVNNAHTQKHAYINSPTSNIEYLNYKKHSRTFSSTISIFSRFSTFSMSLPVSLAQPPQQSQATVIAFANTAQAEKRFNFKFHE